MLPHIPAIEEALDEDASRRPSARLAEREAQEPEPESAQTKKPAERKLSAKGLKKLSSKKMTKEQREIAKQQRRRASLSSLAVRVAASGAPPHG